MPCRRPSFLVVCVCAYLLATAGSAAAFCDQTANATALGDARAAIDAACPCGAATSPSAHVKCAKPVVSARVDNGQLVKT
jgi:hypothetical protein